MILSVGIAAGFPKFVLVIKTLKNLRFLLFPFNILYGGVMAIRNRLFDMGIFNSESFSTPSIGVGNLSMGGTGKSVVVMYLLKNLGGKKHIAVLSRGYGRKTKGIIVATKNDNAATLGDEPFQFLQRYPETLVVVAEKRIQGIKAIEAMEASPDKVILDDVMQHRWIRPQMMIMTSSYECPYFRDFVFPVGGLREFRSGVKRANILLITRSPENLSPQQKEEYLKEINVNIPVFFTKVRYSDVLSQKEKTQNSSILENGFLLVTGIANADHLVIFLKNQYGAFDHFKFKDHHSYSIADGQMIHERAGGKIILTTEKDYAKLDGVLECKNLYYIKIELDFVFEEEQQLFDKMIKSV